MRVELAVRYPLADATDRLMLRIIRVYVVIVKVLWDFVLFSRGVDRPRCHHRWKWQGWRCDGYGGETDLILMNSRVPEMDGWGDPNIAR